MSDCYGALTPMAVFMAQNSIQHSLAKGKDCPKRRTTMSSDDFSRTEIFKRAKS
jgi:hypothetical protein